MKKKPSSQSAFFNFRVLLAFMLCSAGTLLAFAAFGALSGGPALPQRSTQDQNGGLAPAQEATYNNVSPPKSGLVPRQRKPGSPLNLLEATGATGATVTTDKLDYAPGETVVITGSGWTANEAVALHIDESDGNPPWDSSVMADGDGNISNSSLSSRLMILGWCLR